MLRCFNLKSTAATATNPSSSPPSFQGNSREETPRSRSSGQRSPTVNLSQEYTRVVQTNSYNEIWSKIHIHHCDPADHEEEEVSSAQPVAQLADILRPNPASVDEALCRDSPNELTQLVSGYFNTSESASGLCLLLQRDCVDTAYSLYAPVHHHLDLLPINPKSLTQSQCNWAYDVFPQFDARDNPFPHPDSNYFHDMRSGLSQFKLQLDNRLDKSRRRVRLFRRATTGSALCLIGSAVGVTAAAVAIASHAFAALAAAPLCALLPANFTKKDLNKIAQLDAAAKGTFVLYNHLNTIACLVSRLHAAVENDKLLIRHCLDRDRDSYFIQEVVKQLRNNQPKLLHQLNDLEQHICHCFVLINRARFILLQEIRLHQIQAIYLFS